MVLGGGARADKALTPEDRLGDASLKRLLEGVRLSRLLPQTRLVLSGGDYRGISPDALIIAQPPDAPPQDETIEAVVFELDILRELLHKGILHGQRPFQGFFL